MPSSLRRGESRACKPARHAAGALVVFVGISAANVLSPPLQAVIFAIALAALPQRPQMFPFREGIIVSLAATYVVLYRLASGMELDGALRVIRPCLEGYLLATVLFKWCRVRTFRSVAIVLAGFVALQFLIGLAMALDPAGRAAFIENVYADEAYQNSQFAVALLIRGYGLSRHHLYGLSLACGLSAAAMLAWAGIDRRLRAWLGAAALAAILLVAVNARIGLVPIAIAYAAGTLLLRDSFYGKHLLGVVLLMAIPIAYLASVYFSDDFELVWTWLAASLEQFGSADGADSTTLSDLRGMLVFSSNPMELLLGVGRACSANDACYSDIGFVRAIQEGGIIFLALVTWLYWSLIRHVVRFFELSTPPGPYRARGTVLIATVMHLTFIAAMVKGEAFGASDYSRLVAMLACLGMFLPRTRGTTALTRRTLWGGRSRPAAVPA